MIHIAVPAVTVQSVWFSTVVTVHDSYIAVPVVTVQSVWFSTVVSHDSHSSARGYSTICVGQYSGYP